MYKAQRNAQQAKYEAQREKAKEERLRKIAASLKEEYGISKITALGETYAVLPMEVFAEYANVIAVYTHLMEAWNQVINEQRENSSGVELFKACLPLMEKIDKLNDLYAALRFYARSE